MPNYMQELHSRGLTLREYASRVGVSATYVSNVFNGKTTPSVETEKKMKKVLAECPWCGSRWPHPLPKDV